MTVVRLRRPRPWTVMVFMTSDTDLELFADLDLQEMQKVGSLPNKLHVVVQLARRGFPRAARFYVRKGRRQLVDTPPGSKNSGDPRVLAKFLRWAAEHYPARRYMLVLWGHAFGLGFGRVHGNALTIPELANVLREFAATTPSGRLDVLGCDACAMSKVEASYQLRNIVSMLVASQTAVPFAGWAYQPVLQAIADDPRISPRDLGATIVRSYLESYVPRPVALSAVDIDSGASIGAPIEELAVSLQAAVRRKAARALVHDIFRSTATGSEPALIDLQDFCHRLIERNIDAAVTTSAQKTVKAIESMVVSVGSSDHRQAKRAKIIGLNGVGIYAPPATTLSRWELLGIHRKRYAALDLMKTTRWAEVVYGLARVPRRDD